MKNAPDFIEAQRQAERLLQEQNIDELPVYPFAIAKKLNIDLMPMPPQKGGASGMLIRIDSTFGIGYPTHIKNEGFKRLSLSHEIGHFRLPGHPEALVGEDNKHISHAGFVTNDPYELEADHFAASLLMPKKQFTQALQQLPVGMRGIETLKTLCITSLEATAIRYTQCAPFPVAVIRSEGKTIDYAFMSQALTDFPGLTWIKKNTPLPENSNTGPFARDATRIRHGARVTGTSNMEDWFEGCPQEITEEVVGQGKYGKVLTILTGMVHPDDIEDDDDEDLIEAWTPTFHR